MSMSLSSSAPHRASGRKVDNDDDDDDDDDAIVKAS